MIYEWVESIKSREVCIFGCGNTAKVFCSTYADIITPTFFVSNNEKEKEFQLDNQLMIPVIRPHQLTKDKNTFIIICSISAPEIKEQLVLMGYEPYKDFIEASFLEYFLQKKEVILFYGTCHIRAVKECMERATGITNTYLLYFYASYLNHSYDEQMTFQFLVDKCKAIIYSNSFSMGEQIKCNSIFSRLSEKCQRISIPLISFNGYFPKKDKRINYLNKFAVEFSLSNYVPFSFEDEKLNELIEQNIDSYDIIQLSKTFWYDEKEWIVENCEKEFKKMQIIEQHSDLKIVEYVRNNYKKRRLFRNEAHVENEIIFEYVRQILKKLLIDDYVNESCIKESLLNCSEHIIYPAVREALGLEWNTDQDQFELFTYNGWEKLSFSAFMMLYIEYCKSIRKWQEQGLIPVH